MPGKPSSRPKNGLKLEVFSVRPNIRGRFLDDQARYIRYFFHRFETVEDYFPLVDAHDWVKKSNVTIAGPENSSGPSGLFLKELGRDKRMRTTTA